MANDLIIRPQLPAKRPTHSVPALIFGTRPGTIAKRSALYLVAVLVLYFGVLGNIMHRIDADLDLPRPTRSRGAATR